MVCQDKAIKFVNQANGVKIVVDTKLCPQACNKCIDICPENAIAKSDTNKDGQGEFFISYHQCDHCGKTIIKHDANNGKSLCKQCKRILSVKGLLQCNRS